MRTRNIIYQVIIFFTVVSGAWSQDKIATGIKIENHTFVKQQDQLSISFDVLINDLKVNSNNLVLLTPVLKSNLVSKDSVVLPPIVVAGGRRAKILRRNEVLGNQHSFAEVPLALIVRKNNTEQEISYKTVVEFRPWMQDASLSFIHEVSGCANCVTLIGEDILVDNILPEPYNPTYKLTYIVPEAEVKVRSDRHTATFNFVVNRWELLRDYKDNAEKFAQVDRVVNEIRNNTDFKITQFEIHGYASPEASVSHNQMLAQNRANAFADYLVTKFNIDRNLFTVKGHGEDWVGLRNAVEASSLSDKQAILDIIDSVDDPDARDSKLKKLSRGSAYRTLLNNFYPPLRRTEYVVAYSVRPFEVDEAREIIKSNPKLLSLNEMYMVAQSYPAGSDEFKEVFDIAVRLYPDSDIAILNSASADIESGNLDAAIVRMLKIADNPKVWNNLGVAYARKGDFTKAMEYFSKASTNNDGDAAHNMSEIAKLQAN